MVATICLYISVFAWNIPKNDYVEVTEDETTLVKYSIYHIALLYFSDFFQNHNMSVGQSLASAVT